MFHRIVRVGVVFGLAMASARQDVRAQAPGADPLRETVAQLERAVAHFAGERDRLESEIARLRKALTDAEVRRAAAEEQARAARRAADERRDEPARWKRAADEAGRARTAAEEKAAAAEKALAAQRAETEQARTMASAAEKLIARLRAETDGLRAEMERQTAAARAASVRAAAPPAPPSPAAIEPPAVERAPVDSSAVLPPDIAVRPSPPVAADSSDPKALLAAADEALARQQADDAERLYRRVLELRRNDAAAELGLARALSLRGDLPAAARATDALLRRDRKNAAALHFAGQLAGRRGDFKAARDYLTAAVKHAPRDARVRKDLALNCYTLQDFPAAVREFNEVIRLTPEDGEAWFNLSAVLLMLKEPRHDEALAAYERAVGLGEPRDETIEQILKNRPVRK